MSVTKAILGAVLALLFYALPSDAASRRECKPSACRAEIGLCKGDCSTAGSRREQRRCRKKCKGQVTQACRADEQSCGEDGGGGGGGGGTGGGGGSSGGECKAYTPSCPARSLLPLRDRNPTCTGASGDAQPCDYDFDTKFRVRTPWRTHGGECCVVDTCRGATAFGIYDNLAFPPVIPPGSSPLTAPVTVSVQALSNYFQRPSTGAGIPGQWGYLTSTIFNLTCSTPPSARVISTAGGVLTAQGQTDYRSYDTHPVPPPTGSWDLLTLAGDTSVSFAPPHPPLLPPCDSAPDTAKCQPRLFNLETINFPGTLNPITEILSERISIDSLCDDDVYATAEGTFRKQNGSECSVTIHAHAKIGCATNDDCLSNEVCTTTNPTAPADFGNAFTGWAGKSCVVPTP